MNRLSLSCLAALLCGGLLQPLPAGAETGKDPFGEKLEPCSGPRPAPRRYSLSLSGAWRCCTT
ncbi:hypothetical protein CPCC7001_726 [Cyanobium sp. PCC 7001]|nr:hypothetical protein CPCC7001_726 [Cyanobium sp. PCC 7001]